MTTTTETTKATDWEAKQKEKLRKIEFEHGDTRESLDAAHEALHYAVLIAEGRCSRLREHLIRAFEETVAARALLEDLIAGRVEEV